MSEMSRVNTIIRDSLNDTFSQIIVDDETMYSEIKSYIHAIKPEMEHMVKLYKGKVSIFDNFDITKQIKSLFAKYVSLRRGAYLIIEHTEAMHVIDVNSGNRTKAEDDQEQTALEVNLAAAAEIARQLRLRDMGGIVIVDFIDMRQQQSRQTLYQEMQKLMATDKAKHTILPITKFGLMQITRQRVRPIAINEISDTCPTCHGTGKVEPTILLEKKIEGEIHNLADKGVRYVNLRVSPYVKAYLEQGLLSRKLRWIFKYKLHIKITTDQSIGMIDVSYLDKKGESLLTNSKE
jgi:ribonuclease G